MMERTLRGQPLLKVVSVLLIVLALVGAWLGLSFLTSGGSIAFGLDQLLEQGGEEAADLVKSMEESGATAEDVKLFGKLYMLTGGVMLALAVYQAVMGVFGWRGAGAPERAKLLFRLGIAAMIAEIVVVVIGYSLILAILGFVLAALFTVGAYLNRKLA